MGVFLLVVLVVATVYSFAVCGASEVRSKSAHDHVHAFTSFVHFSRRATSTCCFLTEYFNRTKNERVYQRTN